MPRSPPGKSGPRAGRASPRLPRPSLAGGSTRGSARLGDQEAVAGVPALALVVEDALKGRGEQPLELLPQHGQRAARPRGRWDAEGGAEAGEVAAELDVGALAPHRLGRQVGQHQTRVSAEREPDVRRRQVESVKWPLRRTNSLALGSL